MDPLRTKTVPMKADAIAPSRSTLPNTYPPVPAMATVTSTPTVYAKRNGTR